MRILASIAALLLAAGLLAVGVSASKRDPDSPSDVNVVPGKVSVLGDAKVRRWRGQTFSVEVPLEWERTATGLAQGANATQVHQWALLAPGVAASDPRARDLDWKNARDTALARLVVQISPYPTAGTVRGEARRFADDLPSKAGYRFGDNGPVYLGSATTVKNGRYAWRLNVESGGDLETHYFFATCEAGEPRELWHVIFDRRSVRDQQPTLQSTLKSLDTLYRASPADRKNRDCAA